MNVKDRMKRNGTEKEKQVGTFVDFHNSTKRSEK